VSIRIDADLIDPQEALFVRVAEPLSTTFLPKEFGEYQILNFPEYTDEM
jgi:hypothetical protein